MEPPEPEYSSTNPVNVVPRTLTPIADTVIAPLLSQGLAQRIGATPVRELAMLLLAQLWTETRQGKPIQWNIANLSAGGIVNGMEVIQWTGAVWRPPWFDQAEIDQIQDAKLRAERQAQHAQMLAGQIPSAFKAFGSIEEGLGAYLDLIFKPIYHSLLVAAATGDPLAFAQAIKEHYNPDPRYDPVATSHTFASLVQAFTAKGLFDWLPKGDSNPPVVAPPSPSPPFSPQVFSPADVFVPSGDAHLFRLTRGVRGGAVKLWQVLLNERLELKPPLAISGVFDLSTETATKNLQAKHGLTDDGVVGPKTWGSIL